jgi:hypothetical protein
MAKIKMVLTGGEKDGLGQNGELLVEETDRPEVFYAVPNLDEDKIKKTRGLNAKHEMRDKLAVLAYKFDPDKSTSSRSLMRRAPELDKVRPCP